MSVTKTKKKQTKAQDQAQAQPLVEEVPTPKVKIKEAKCSKDEINDYINQQREQQVTKEQVEGLWEAMETMANFASDVVLDLNEDLDKLSSRRDKWRERYDSVKATLIKERKQQAMINSTLLNLISSGAVKVVPNTRGR